MAETTAGRAVELPGSDEAIAKGCTCPVLDNGHGKNGPPFWITEGCPLHAAPPTEENS